MLVAVAGNLDNFHLAFPGHLQKLARNRHHQDAGRGLHVDGLVHEHLDAEDVLVPGRHLGREPDHGLHENAAGQDHWNGEAAQGQSEGVGQGHHVEEEAEQDLHLHDAEVELPVLVGEVLSTKIINNIKEKCNCSMLLNYLTAFCNCILNI